MNPKRYDMRSWRFVPLLIALACGSPEPQFPSYAPFAGNPELLTEEDVAVYEAVIPVLGPIFGTQPAPPPPGIVVPREDVPSVSKPVLVLRPHTRLGTEVRPHPGRWLDLAGQQVTVSIAMESAMSDFRQRNARRASLKRFHSKHAQITWGEGAPVGTKIYSFTLPGYSRARDGAILEVSVSDSPMSGGGCLLVLRKEGLAWRVVGKQRTWIS